MRYDIAMTNRLFLAFLAAILLLGQFGCGSSPLSVDVRSLGATGDGKTKDTLAFQAALDKCCAAGGGSVYVPPGTYVIGSIVLPSNTTLSLEKDANLQGSPDLNDYPVISVRWEGRWIPGHRALISADGAHDIAVIGPGHIAADPKLAGRAMPRRPTLIEPINCTDIRLQGFSTHHSTMWSIHPTYCQNVTARNLTIRSSGGNGDGIDVDSCRNVRIESCDIDTGDDCIALKSGRGLEGYHIARPTEDVLISHCTLGDSIFACIGIGSEDSGGIRNIRIEHCTFTHANTDAIYIKSRVGRGADMENISGDDLDVTAKGFLRINLLNSGIAGADPVPGDAGIPTGRNYSFTNVKVNVGTLVEATSISPARPLDGLTIANVNGVCTRGIELANITGAHLSDIRVAGYSRSLLATFNVTGTGLEGAAAYKPKPTTNPAPQL
jgi:polygalacturonase